MSSVSSIFAQPFDKSFAGKVKRFVCCTCGILFVVTVIVLSGYFAYSFTHDHQVEMFEQDYESFANSAAFFLRKAMLEDIRGARTVAAGLGVVFPSASSWPFVYLLDYNSIVSLLDPIRRVNFGPLVSPDEAEMFEEFAYRNFNRTYKNKVAQSSFGEGIFAPVDINEFEGLRYHDVSGNTSYGSPNRILTPILQGNESVLMFNWHSDPFRGRTIDAVIRCALEATTSTAANACGSITAPTLTLSDRTLASFAFFPVFPADNSTTLVGLTQFGLRWNQILASLFPTHVSQIHCVLQADNVAYTFVIVAGQVTKVLPRDAHQAEMTKYAKVTPIASLDYLQSASASYTLTMYPTRRFRARYVNNQPTYTVLVVVVIEVTFFTALVCGLYFVWSRRRAAVSASITQAKRMFIRYISHEIRTPLNTVSLGLSLLLTELGSDIATHHPFSHLLHSPSHNAARHSSHISKHSLTRSNSNTHGGCSVGVQRKLVAELIENSQSAVMLLDDLLSFEQLESGEESRDMMERHLLPVWELLRTAIAAFEVRARLSEVQLVTALEIDNTEQEVQESQGLSAERRTALEALRVLGNEPQLKRVLSSLLGNALQYSREGGQITITAVWIEHPGASKKTKRPRPVMVHRHALRRLYEQGRARYHTAHRSARYSAYSVNSSSWDGSRVGMQRAGVLRVAVTDQGEGMTPEQTAQVFGKGKRFSLSALQAGQGSGIGLFVCKIIAKQHHATIRVTSPGLGLGSTYTLDLPVFAAPVQIVSQNNENDAFSKPMETFLRPTGGDTPPRRPPLSIENKEEREADIDRDISEASPFTQKRILVVDDAPSNRKMLVRVLAKQGHVCEQAHDGQVAVDMVQEAERQSNPYDMILMDFEMPVMNGPTATAKLRELGYTVPIVGVSGNVLCADVEYFMAQGADAVLPKPLQLDALEAVWTKRAHRKQVLRLGSDENV